MTLNSSTKNIELGGRNDFQDGGPLAYNNLYEYSIKMNPQIKSKDEEYRYDKYNGVTIIYVNIDDIHVEDN